MSVLRWTTSILIALCVATTGTASDRVVWGFEFVSEPVHGNLIVLPGGHAVLSGTLIDGDAIVHPGGTMTSNTRMSMMQGDIIADRAENIALVGDIVGGSVSITRSANIYLYDTYIGRDVTLRSNDVLPWIAVLFSDIGGSVNVLKNVSALDIFVLSNVIGRNLNCINNTPPAQITAPQFANNRVGGKVRCDDVPLRLTSLRR